LRGALVLAGGRSRRFKGNKVVAKLIGVPLVVHVLKAAIEVADEVIVSIGRNELVSTYAKIIPNSVKIVNDNIQVKSPLVGIIAGFSNMNSEYSLVLSCDVPFANGRVLQLLFRKANNANAVIPLWPNGNIEPLQAVYKVKPTILAAKYVLRHEGYSVTQMIDRLRRVRYVSVREIEQLDKELCTFFNVNTRRDLRRAKALMKRQKNFRISNR